MKLALGTAQFGLQYGAFNADGQVPEVEVQTLLNAARDIGIDTLDTASAYGSSEDILGRMNAAQTFRVVTKCPALEDCVDPTAFVSAAFDRSCAALKVSQVYGYLLHNAADLAGPQADAIWAALETLRDANCVERIGVSCYNIDEARSLCARYPLSLVQLPGNVLMPWYLDSPLPAGVEVHVRSAFMQGFLLSDPNKLTGHFAPWRATLERFRTEAQAQGLTPLQASLAPLLLSPAIDRVVVGVDRLSQLEDILTATTTATKIGGDAKFGPFPEITSALTDPRKW